MKPTHSANRNASKPSASRTVTQQRQIALMRRALLQGDTEPVSLVVARFFTAA